LGAQFWAPFFVPPFSDFLLFLAVYHILHILFSIKNGIPIHNPEILSETITS